jgi:hypothetical protein
MRVGRCERDNSPERRSGLRRGPQSLERSPYQRGLLNRQFRPARTRCTVVFSLMLNGALE